MTEPVQLITRPSSQNQETVDMLKDYLRMAEAGEIIGIAVVGLCPDGAVNHRASSTDRQMTMIGGVSRLLHRMHLNADEGIV